MRVGKAAIILLGLALALAAAFPAFCAQPAGVKNFHVFILDSQAGLPYDEICAAVLTSLAEAGYSEGKNLQVTIRYADNDVKRGERLLAELAKTPADVVLAVGTPAALAAKNVLYGKRQPVVFASVTDPVGGGMIRAFGGSPGENFTGVSYPVPVKARLKFLRRLMPKAKTLGVIYADMPQSHSYNRWLENLAKSDPEFKGVKFLFRQVPLYAGEEGELKMAALVRRHVQELDGKVDAYLNPCDQLGARKPFSSAVYAAAKHPLIGLVRDDVMDRWGATAAIYPSHASIGRQAALMVTKLFAGKRVADVPAEWPQKFGIAVDLRKAKRFGIEVPVELLQMAGENIVR